jgi:hypothetical protein
LPLAAAGQDIWITDDSLFVNLAHFATLEIQRCIASPPIKTKSMATIFRKISQFLSPTSTHSVNPHLGVSRSAPFGCSVDTFSDGQYRGLSTVFDAELAEESFEVTLDRFPSHVDNATDFLVVESLRD